MRPLDFADAHLGEYQVKGDEVIPKYCPYCKGGQNGDINTFALNTESLAYNCKRGTCGANGAYHHLLRDWGELADNSYEGFIARPSGPTLFTRPEVAISPLSEKVQEYLRLRCLSPEV